MSELFLKDKKVLTFKDVEGVPREIIKIDTPELLPICLKDKCTFDRVMEWLERRSISSKREGMEELIREYGNDWLKNKNYASLSDQYWIKKRDEQWKKVNFFTNAYSTDIGDMFFKPWEMAKKRIVNNSPDLTTGGITNKRWIQNQDKSSFLVKAGHKETHQDPLSEVLVSILAEQLDIIPYVSYDLYIEGITMCARCDNFITQDTEFIPAYQIYFLEQKNERDSVYNHILKMAEKNNIPDVEDFLNGMIFIDNLTGNEDRNLSNFGFIRDINSMQFIGPAPLFDSGNAYWESKKINEAKKSKMFGDVEEGICNRMKSKCNLSTVYSDHGYKKLIQNYPGITESKKENLIAEINKRNNRLLKERKPDLSR